MVRARDDMAAALAAFFVARRGEIVAPLLRAYGGKGAKALGSTPDLATLTPEELAAEVQRLLDLMDMTPWEGLPADIQPLLEGIAKDGGLAGLAQVNAGDVADALHAMDARAVAWAQERAAEMVGMKWVDGSLVPNPDAAWSISDATRELVRADVTQALQEGWSNQTLMHALEESDAFTRERAEMIARTETAYADAAANQAAWRESGMATGKEWLLAEAPCDICQGNADAGVIGLDEAFPSGDTEEPAHPRCECVTVPVLKE